MIRTSADRYASPAAPSPDFARRPSFGEHARIRGKEGTVRTVPLDDRGYVALLKLCLARAGYTSGPLFRASINGRGGPLSYDAAHSRWTKYCAAAGTGTGIHPAPSRSRQ